MKKLFLLFCFPFFLYAQYSDTEALNSISSDEIYKTISFLASDSLKGRAAGTDESLIAAMFIADKFRSAGLKPLIKKENIKLQKAEDEDEKEFGYDIDAAASFNEYFQRFSFEKTLLTENNDLAVIRTTGESYVRKAYSFGVDFLVQYYGAADLVVEAPVVFAGYGITNGEDGYNDYIDSTGREIDVRNKIVVIFDGYPGQNDSTSKFSKGRNPQYRNPLRKADAALEKGALGVILISSPLLTDPQIQVKYERLAKAFLRPSDHLSELPKKSLPIIYINKNVVNDIFEGTSIKLKEIAEKIDRTLKPNAMELRNKKLSFSLKVKNQLVHTQNIIGFLEGSDTVLKNEVLVIGAHYDHVGVGYYGAMHPEDAGKIHNGADDNASGTAGLIELVEAFSKCKPRRSILFIAFSAEENGLIGSKYYVYEQPLKPIEKTVAMLNLDMIGRNNEKLLWVGGAFYTEDLRKIVEQANKQTGFELMYNVGLLINASDQAPFLRKKIPVLFFFAGEHPDYHTPSDDVEKINTSKVQNVSRLAFLTAEIIAGRDQRPEYRELSLEERSRLVKDSINRQKLYEK